MRVLLADQPSDPMNVPFGDRHELTRCNAFDLEALGQAIRDVDAIVLRGTPLPKSVIDRGARLRFVQKTGAGFDKMDLSAATAKGVPISTTPGSNAISVAEHVFFLMLTVARGADYQRGRLQRGEWRDYAHAIETFELFEQTVGIISLGAIGQEVARRARGFGMRILASSRTPRPEVERELGVERVALDELFRQSDFVVPCCPLTNETRGLIGGSAIEQMKRTAFVINIARGPVVDTGALVEALRSGRIAGAGVDVFDVEPAPASEPLLNVPNLVATPHIAGITAAAQRRTWRYVSDNLDRVERGEQPQWIVNPEVFDPVRV
ncbi:MAG: hydroxyacid dehydrogenase [Chloroflexi bacterium]|nr:hydroxyacid dehydrogenase [Chloroflexota bacterium]